jgi:lysozyme
MRADMEHFENDIQQALNVPVTQPQFDALCSLVYNIGPGNFKKSSVLSCLNSGDVKRAQARFLLWNKAGGKTLRGLTRRRLAEAVMFGPVCREELIDTYNLDV